MNRTVGGLPLWAWAAFVILLAGAIWSTGQLLDACQEAVELGGLRP